MKMNELKTGDKFKLTTDKVYITKSNIKGCVTATSCDGCRFHVFGDQMDCSIDELEVTLVQS